MEYLKRVVKGNNIEDIYLTGFVDIENGILQLVDENIHTEFTHIGHSIYK